MHQAITEQMLSAAELLYYSGRFYEELFTVVLGRNSFLNEVFPDLKVIYAARINILICCRASDELARTIESWNPRGYKFDYIPGREGLALAARIEGSLAVRRIPVVALPEQGGEELPPSPFFDEATSIALARGSKKIFFVSSESGLRIGEELASCPSDEEIAAALAGTQAANLPAPTIEYLHRRQREANVDLVLLGAKAGSLFQEVFTHRGAGTLFSGNYPNVLRRAELGDARDIALLMKPYINAGIILPVSEDEIARDISDYYLYSINNQIVATAKLTDFREAYEIAKISTLPRYRRKGLARKLVEELIAVSRAAGKHYVFSVSVEAMMGTFFAGLGFTPIPREALPAAWQAGYDFSRPSRAFKLELDAAVPRQ